MAELRPPDDPMQWPIDIFDERAAYAKRREELVLQIDTKMERFHEIRRESEARAKAARLWRIGLPPLILT